MTLASLENVVRADTLDNARVGKPFAFPDLIRVAGIEGKASSVVIRDGKLYQLVVVPVLAPDPIAWVGLAFEVDDRVAQELNQLTGLEVSFASRMARGTWQLHASTLAPPLREDLLASLVGDQGLSSRVQELELGGEEYETRVTPLESRPDKRIVAVLQKPLEVGLAPFRRISSSFFWLTLAGLAMLVAGSLVIARSITRPVHRLAEAAHRVQQGDYTRHVDVEHKDEIGQLAVSFNHMLDGIVSREKEILRLAYEDGLTGLPNRAMFNEQLEQAVRTAKRASAPLAVLLFDMDRFKAINDTLGHPVGDQALREVGLRVRKALRDSDVVARLGGDEFAVLLATGGAEHAAEGRRREDPQGARGAARDRRPVHGHGRQHRHRALSRARRGRERAHARRRRRDVRGQAHQDAATRSTTRATTSAARNSSRCWASCAARSRRASSCCITSPR